MGKYYTWAFEEPGVSARIRQARQSPLAALMDARGTRLYRMEADGDCIHKCNSRDATAMLGAFARECALRVSHLWDAPDVVMRWLETGDPAFFGPVLDVGFPVLGTGFPNCNWEGPAALSAKWASTPFDCCPAHYSAKASAGYALKAIAAAEPYRAVTALNLDQCKSFNAMARHLFEGAAQ